MMAAATAPSPAAPPGDLTLVTGAAGHLGANLVQHLLAAGQPLRVLLEPGADASAMDGLPVERVTGDLRDPSAMARAVEGCRRIYHAAARVSTIDGDAAHRRDIFDTNVVGTRNLLTAARTARVERVVVTGSFSAVGHHLDDPSRPADETVPFFPFERAMPYERSKVLVELEALRAVADGLDVVIATSCAIVGPNDFLPSRMGRTLCDHANGRLRAYVPGGFEFVAARDIVQGHLLAMERGRTGHKYIFSTQFLTLDDVLDVFEDTTGVPKPSARVPAAVLGPLSEVASRLLTRFRPAHPQRLTPGAIRLLQLRRRADITKARCELGYEPTSVVDAIREQYAFFHARGAITNPAARLPTVTAEPASPLGCAAAPRPASTA
ncbi:MAG: NAD-dependent epimerase/dehydratase family protein [Deltaproteobacteria bacterium]|nr:NAD-dependent epimerase/dehydratase family protein [Deltaproteobacteria bacterium]